MPKIVYLGPEYSFHHLAAQKFFENNCINNANQLALAQSPSGVAEFVGVDTFENIFERVSNQDSDFGIIAVENSLAGSVTENFDLLYKYNVQVCGELIFPICHCLLAKYGVQIKDLMKVYSHQKALEQCQKFLKSHTAIIANSFKSTADAVKLVAGSSNPHWCAIGSYEAGQEYGLSVLQKNIQDDLSNWTRFLIVKKEDKQYDQNSNKATIIFKISHETGSLARILGVLALYHCNLTKIESRPIQDKPFEYIFYIDLSFQNLGLFQKEVYRSYRHATYIKVLGCYDFQPTQ